MTFENITKEELAAKIQQTNVNPDATKDDMINLCAEAKEYGFDGVMIPQAWVPLAKKELEGTNIKVCTALGYPMGGSTTAAKVFEAKNVFEMGADELDFMANIGFLKSGMYDEYRDEIRQVVEAADGKPVKIMLEFGMLTQEEKKIAANLAIEAGITYLKNSSGWGKGGKATVEDIKLLKEIAGDKVKVKASGGIKTREDAIALMEAGAVLLGASSGVSIVSGEEDKVNDSY